MVVKLPVPKALVDPGGQDQDPDDLHEGQEAVEQVVDVVGRGEPGEVDPGPPDGEEHREVADDGRMEVAGPQGGVELVGRLGDRHHEGEVEQQLERRRGPVLLVNVPRAHREHPEPAARHGRQYRSASNSRLVTRARDGLRTGPERTKPPRAEAQRGFREKSRRRPTLPGGLPPSTIGAGGLNCRVRNGNGCFPAAMATGNLALSGARPSVDLSTDRATPEAAFPQPLSVPKRARASRSPSPRPISTGRLNALLHLHLRPINVVV